MLHVHCDKTFSVLNRIFILKLHLETIAHFIRSFIAEFC